MKMVRTFRVFGLATMTLMACQAMFAQAGASQDPLLMKLRAEFVPTKFKADKSDIVTAGAVVALQKDGLSLYTVAVPKAPINVYKNGKLSQGMGDRLKVCMLDNVGREGGCDGIPKKTLVTGEKLWISDILLAEDSIQIQLVTDPYDDGRYFGTLKFPIPKGSVPAPDDAARAISEVLVVQPQQDAPAPDQRSQQAPPPVPAPTAASYQELPPPPPPPAPAPSISVGMTPDQVITAFGEPARKASVGTKEIFFYTDTKTKITFSNGKVSNIE
jgi:hypothetical protein